VKPEITVVVPTHNRRDFLPLTLRTILAQREVGLEVVVVDDGSIDDTRAVVCGLHDRRVRLIRHDRVTGVTTARNHGAEEATGQWLAFCDDDDLWAPDKLAQQLAATATTGRRWCYGGAVRIDVALRIMGGTPPVDAEQLTARLPHWNLVPGGSSNVIVHADTFQATGGWDPGLVNLADWDLWVRLARTGPPACVAAPLVGYRIHNGNASADTELILREARLLDGRHGVTLDYGALHHYLAWVCLRSGRRRPAARHFARAAAAGQGRPVVRTTATLASRRLLNRVAFKSRPRPCHTAWIAAAEKWIAPLRNAP